MKELLVFGDRTFRIKVPDDAKITFGPWSPPQGKGGWGTGSHEEKRGTLRIYGRTKDDVLAVFAGVMGFRDLSLDYQEKVATEEGATLWKDDQKGYQREERSSRTYDWTDPIKKLPAAESKAKKKAVRNPSF